MLLYKILLNMYIIIFFSGHVVSHDNVFFVKEQSNASTLVQLNNLNSLHFVLNIRKPA